MYRLSVKGAWHKHVPKMAHVRHDCTYACVSSNHHVCCLGAVRAGHALHDCWGDMAYWKSTGSMSQGYTITHTADTAIPPAWQTRILASIASGPPRLSAQKYHCNHSHNAARAFLPWVSLVFLQGRTYCCQWPFSCSIPAISSIEPCLG